MFKSPADVGSLRRTRRPSAKTVLMAALTISVLAIACIAIFSESDDSDAAYASSVWVNGTEVTPSQSYSVSNGVANATASYNSSTGTLTLTNFYSKTVTYSNTYQFTSGSYASIYSSGDLNITFAGSYSNQNYTASNIKFASSQFGGNTPSKTYGVYADGNLTITSTITSSAISEIIFSPGAATTETCGIKATGTVTLQNIDQTVNAIGGTTSYGNDVADKTSFGTYGIYGNKVTIQYCKDIRGSTKSFVCPTCYSGLIYSCGIYSYSEFTLKGNNTYGCKLTATSGDIDATYFRNIAYEIHSAGIYSEGRLNWDTRATDLTVYATGGDVYFDTEYDGNVNSEGAVSYGIRGSSMYCDTKIIATGGVVFLPVILDKGDSFGIWLSGGFEGNGANVSANGSDAAVHSCGMIVNNGDFDTGYNSTVVARAGFVALTGNGVYCEGLKVNGNLIGRSGSVVNAYGGAICYEQYTAGIVADSITLYNGARVTGYGGDTYKQYTSKTKYTEIPFEVLTGSSGDSCGIYIFDGSISVEAGAILRGEGGTIRTDQYLYVSRVTAGIRSYINLSISGAGRVEGLGGNTLYGRDTDTRVDHSYGIYTGGTLTIDGTTVVANGGNVCTIHNIDRTYANGAVSGGIHSTKNLTITGGADVTATGGRHSYYATYNTGPRYHDSIGVYVLNGSLTISSNSVLRATGTEEGAMRLIGMRVYGAITVNTNSQIIVDVPAAWNPNDGKLSTYDKLGRGSYGIYIMNNAESADITINSGTLTVRAQTKAIVSENNDNTLSAPNIAYGNYDYSNFGSTTTSTTFSNISSKYYIMATNASYTLSFNKNSGSGSMSSMTGQFGNIRLPSCDFTAPTGKHFAGWCRNSDGSGTVYGASAYMPVTENITLYAIWEDTQYNIFFYPGSGSGDMDTQHRTYNQTIALPANEFTAPSHATFKCWSVNDVEKNVGDVLTITADVIVWAVWDYEQVPVSFEANGGTDSMPTENVSWGHGYRLPWNGFTAPEHMHFKCWSVGGVEMAPNDLIESVEEPVTVTAVWEYNNYQVTFNDYNYSQLQVSQVTYGQKPSYDGENPSRAADAQYTYTFAGWSLQTNQTTGTASADLPAVTGPTEYYAAYSTTVNTYTVTWKSQDGQTVLETDENVPYGTAPSFDLADPDMQDTAQYDYTFVGWYTSSGSEAGTLESGLPTVTGDTTYYAAFSVDIQRYTVTWKSQDGQETLETDQGVEYGTAPDFNSYEPTKDRTAQYTFAFVGWATSANQTSGTAENGLQTVAGDVTYYAAFSETVNTYTVAWVTQDGSQVLETDENVPYGTAVSFDGNAPTKDRTAQYTFTFVGWAASINQTAGTAAGDLPTVSGTVRYYAAFSETVNTYTVVWKSQDGLTVLETDENIPYGTEQSFDLTDPVKENTAQYTFEFAGWANEANSTVGTLENALPSVSDDVTYYAAFAQYVNSYTVRFLNAGGQAIQSDNLEYGAMPEFVYSDPVKDEDDMYTYEFSGWSPEIGTVTGAVDYVPVFASTLKTYDVTFYANGGDGTMNPVTANAGAYTLPANGFTAPANHYFTGWALNSANGTVYLAGSEYTLLSDVSFYAVWADHLHEYVPIPAVAPTCTATGLTEGQECSICHDVIVEQQVVDALGHDYVATVVAPTCTEGGYTTHVCSRCGDHYEDTPTDPLGHDYSPTFEWSADGSSCIVHIICARDSAHNHDINALVTPMVETPASVGAMGVTAYIVNGTYDGCGYTDIKHIADIPALEPEIVVVQTEGTNTYTNTVTENAVTRVTEIFNTAKDNSGAVEVSVPTAATATPLTISFDTAAVNAIAGNAVTLAATVTENSTEVADAKLVIEVTLAGATFSDGKAKVSVPLSQSVPEGKIVKVYFINGDVREDMNATLVDGKVVFETNHFSTYAVFFEDQPSSDDGSGSNGKGFPIGLAIGGAVAVIALAGAAAFFFLRKN